MKTNMDRRNQHREQDDKNLLRVEWPEGYGDADAPELTSFGLMLEAKRRRRHQEARLHFRRQSVAKSFKNKFYQ